MMLSIFNVIEACMLRPILYLLIFFSCTVSATDSDCSRIDTKNICEYYSCIEEQRLCGQKGYLLGFGKKYCLKFDESERYFSDAGKEWSRRVRECLISNLDLPSSLSCKKFKKNQIKAHVPCYVKSGYCELSRKDRFALKKVIYKSMWRPSLIWAGVKVLAKCRL